MKGTSLLQELSCEEKKESSTEVNPPLDELYFAGVADSERKEICG